MALTKQHSDRAWPSQTIVLGVLALLAALLVSLFALAPRAEAYVYWTNSNASGAGSIGIGRADLDGTGVRSRFIPLSSPSAYLSDLALDAKHVYWAAACVGAPCTSGAIGRANLDGTGVDPTFIGGIDPDPTGVVVDGEHVYWTWSECDAGCSIPELQTAAGAIGRANLDGTGVDQSFVGINPPGGGAPSGDLAVDAQHIYWTGSFCEGVCSGETLDDRVVHAIGRANLDGTGVDRSFIITGSLPGLGEVIGVDGTDLALDAEHLYWTGRVFSPACCGTTLGRANLDGSGVDQGFIDGPCCFYSPAWSGVAVDDAHIYWVQGQRDQPTRSIVRANLDGTGVDPTFIPPSGDSDFQPGVVALDALTVTKAEGRASAVRTQRQTGKKIVVRVRVKAKEELTARAKGKVKVNPAYKLRPEAVEVARGDARRLRLKPKKAQAKKIARALKRGETAKAKLTVKLTDQAGNTESERLRVRLKRR
jgi:hypothetical protein